MAKFPILDLHSTLVNGNIFISVGEAGNSCCSGRLTVTIYDVSNGKPMVRTKSLTNIGIPLQDITINDTPKTGKIHPVVAVLQLDSGENKQDDDFIFLKR